ncbi:hypothetical protein WA026_015947 [Henosepilachna vigintioctopunctata]|uniref:UDENN domain-containing protein n=1 Tax=Henosepilachna vigintioctopunctata TaxID=420089 RepID=A0AAW1TZ94_9CUCU
MDEKEKLLIENSVNIKQLINVFEEKKNNINIEKKHNSSSVTNGILANNDTKKLIDDEVDYTSENNLENLRNSLEQTISDSFNEETTDELRKNSLEEEEESFTVERKSSVDDTTMNKFRTYVKNVSVYAKNKPQSKKSTLFECCLIVEWNADVRRIKFKFPHDVQVPHKIEDLCFPDAAYGPLDKTTNAQTYSLVITNDKGERTFGYCRRVVPEGSNKCLPIAYCILSKHKSPRFYKKILTELESRHGISEYHRNNLLKAFFYNKYPQPGETVTIKLGDNDPCQNSKEEEKVTRISESLEDSIESNFVIVNKKGEFESLSKNETTKSNSNFYHNFDLCEESGDIMLNLHHDPIFEISDLKDLHELPIDILHKIFASLLLERKVILISCLLSKLSSCIEALQAIIYPFTWPHSFIPVLPKSLWEFVEAPTPIICGILSVEVINNHEIEYGIVVDLDEKCILKEEGDEDKALSNSMYKVWRKNLNTKNVAPDPEGYSYNLTDAYIQVFAMVLKNYRDYIVNGNFQKEAFIRSGKTRGIRRFLNWFTDTTMFSTFVDAVITNSQDFSLFDKKIALYGNSGLSLDKLLDWKL